MEIEIRRTKMTKAHKVLSLNLVFRGYSKFLEPILFQLVKAFRPRLFTDFALANHFKRKLPNQKIFERSENVGRISNEGAGSMSH